MFQEALGPKPGPTLSPQPGPTLGGTTYNGPSSLDLGPPSLDPWALQPGPMGLPALAYPGPPEAPRTSSLDLPWVALAFQRSRLRCTSSLQVLLKHLKSTVCREQLMAPLPSDAMLLTLERLLSPPVTAPATAPKMVRLRRKHAKKTKKTTRRRGNKMLMIII